MWAARYWANRYFAKRYWTNNGANVTVTTPPFQLAERDAFLPGDKAAETFVGATDESESFVPGGIAWEVDQ